MVEREPEEFSVAGSTPARVTNIMSEIVGRDTKGFWLAWPMGRGWRKKYIAEFELENYTMDKVDEPTSTNGLCKKCGEATDELDNNEGVCDTCWLNEPLTDEETKAFEGVENGTEPTEPWE